MTTWLDILAMKVNFFLLERWLQQGVGASLNTSSIHNKEVETLLGVE